MPPHYSDWDYKGSNSVARVATQLYRVRDLPCRLSPLVLMSDPGRLPECVRAVQNLPEGATFIYRHFGKSDRQDEAQVLRQVTLARRQQFLIGNDPDLAIKVGADGVHFRRDAALKAPALWRQRCPDWLITMAGVKDGTPYARHLDVLDGLFVSSVFDSQSPSAGPALGLEGFKTVCAALSVPVFALGGVSATTAPKLIGSSAAGLAGVSGLIDP